MTEALGNRNSLARDLDNALHSFGKRVFWELGRVRQETPFRRTAAVQHSSYNQICFFN